MASSVTENVIRWGKKLERYTDESMILSVIHKLSKVPVTVDLLQETGIGKVVRGLAKKPGKIGEKASAVLHNWRKVVASAQKTPDTPSYEKPSKEKRSHSHTQTNPKYRHESKSSYSKSEQNVSSPNYMIKEESDGDSRELFHPDIEIRTKESSKNSVSHLVKKHKSSSSEDIHLKSKKQKLEFLEKSSHGDSSEKEKVKKNSNEPSSKDSHKHGSKSHDKKYKDSKKSKDSDKKSSPRESTKKSLGKVASSTDAFTSSEALFEDCLSFNDVVPVKRKKSSKTSSHTSSGLKTVSQDENLSIVETKSKSSKHKSSKSSSASHSSAKEEPKPKEGSSKKEKPEQLPLVKEDPCIASSLPQPQLNYRPLPRNYDCFPIKRKAFTNEEAIMFTSSKKEKTVVYSGRRNFLTAVPSLQESCTRVLIEHIDAIEYVGGLPYYLLKPVLERCTPQQLLNIEDYNPDLLEDTRELWEIHCKKDFRTHKPEENETWRDLYLRAFEDREKRLKAITKNISASMTKSTTASRSTKLTYVDSYVKPPRDVARKQEKNGTGLPVNHSLKVGPPSKASPRPTAPAINSAAVSSSKSEYVPRNTKPKVAPLMAKTLKSMKQCFRR